MTWKEFLILCINDLPIWVYEAAASIFVMLFVSIICFCKRKNRIRLVARLFLIEYVTLTLASTILFRSSQEERNYDYQPFWSYKAIEEGNNVLLYENIFNVLAFVPIGLSTSLTLKKTNWLYAILCGMLLSVIIEALQFCFMKGFSEIDDIFHNTMGCILGLLIYQIVYMTWRYSMNLFK